MGSFLEAGREQNNTAVSLNTHPVGPSEQGGGGAIRASI